MPTRREIPRPLFFWRDKSWAAAHIYSLCTRAFMEHPAGFGVEQMRSARSLTRIARLTPGVCPECWARFEDMEVERARRDAAKEGQLAE